MALEITGKLFKVLAEVTGAGKNGSWVKQEFVIETMEQYPKKVCCSAWGEKVSIKGFQPGDQLKVSFNIESREYNERWYTDLRAWKIEALSGSVESSNPATAQKENFPGDVTSFTAEGGEADDLPF